MIRDSSALADNVPEGNGSGDEKANSSGGEDETSEYLH
jgi:hypothetical protein